MDHSQYVRSRYLELMSEGVTVLKRSIDPVQCDSILEKFTLFREKNAAVFSRHTDQHGHLPRIINLHLALPHLFDLFCKNPDALAVQDLFFGAPACLYTSLYYERGSAQPPHRDSPYFTTQPEYSYLGVWVALEAATPDNGCLQVIRKGHSVPEIDREAIARRLFPDSQAIPDQSQELWDEYQASVTNACFAAGLRVENVEAEKGDTIIWHPQLPHGGSQIADLARTRHSFVMHTTPVGTPVYHMSVFFNPSKPVPQSAPWGYREVAGRCYAMHRFVDFAHADPRDPNSFVPLQ